MDAIIRPLARFFITPFTTDTATETNGNETELRALEDGRTYEDELEAALDPAYPNLGPKRRIAAMRAERAERTALAAAARLERRKKHSERSKTTTPSSSRTARTTRSTPPPSAPSDPNSPPSPTRGRPASRTTSRMRATTNGRFKVARTTRNLHPSPPKAALLPDRSKTFGVQRVGRPGAWWVKRVEREMRAEREERRARGRMGLGEGDEMEVDG